MSEQFTKYPHHCILSHSIDKQNRLFVQLSTNYLNKVREIVPDIVLRIDFARACCCFRAATSLSGTTK